MKHLILLHGAIGSGAQLNALAQTLQEAYSVHIINFPGHGGKESSEAFSIPFFAAYVQQYCSDNGIDTAILFGYSMGGYVGLYLAAQHPGLVEGIITLGTKFHWDETVAAREAKMLQPGIIQEKLPKFAAALAERHAPFDWKEVLSKTETMLLEMGRQNPLKRQDYESINIPVRLMIGDRDKMVSLEETVSVYTSLPNGSMAVLPNTPHPIEMADSRMLQLMIDNFTENIYK